MRSIKHQILLLLLGSLVLLAACFLAVLGWYMKDRVVAAAIIKAQTDLATCEEIIDKTYPGPWSVKDGNLYKGSFKINLNNDLVDHLSKLTGDTVTIFLGDTRIATTVRGSNGERVIGTKVSDNVAKTVLEQGQTYIGEANVVGQWHQTGYMPLRAENGNIVGIFYVGISRTYEQEIMTRSLLTMAGLGLGLTILVALITWFFIQKMIIYPLHNITLGTRDVATGHDTEKVKVSGAKEIWELEDAFNQMVEKFQSFTGEINRVSDSHTDAEINNVNIGDVAEPAHDGVGISEVMMKEAAREEGSAEVKQQSGDEELWCVEEEALPKGLNQSTLNQILGFLQVNQRPLSSEDVAEGVKLTRVTVRRYLEFLEERGILISKLKYGVGRPVKLFIPSDRPFDK
ncbi:response regulator of citrate/malate metabolism [Desulfosporosinus orientis DSM 765]|uniref:Response regulator of citrate/malate metabolism n=1 Tax=Desulfosporosinus orientis (strain ATCC 19365 / DSM 765 / NCIMB 8382 / VKM B-1628 / Singapore I) TaxID=768706 RepID=G7W9L3_DESOD|nr:cache domain-containing protein [Desulfosporosinus orientis]AET69930.1 response regulator of citrate/malate metabolism [Desulfosporosinus orientis DSM 765]